MSTTTVELAKARQEILVSTKPILAQVETLTVTDAPSYALADALLAKIRSARKVWTDRVGKILDPLNAALKEARGLRNEIDNPLETAENHLRVAMQQFKIAEAAQAERERRVREAEEAKIQLQLKLKQAQAEAARTAPMRAKLEAQAAQLEVKQAEVAAAPIATPVQVSNSATRTIRKVRVVDIGALIKGIAFAGSLPGGIPSDVLMVNTVFLNEYYRTHKGEVEHWPGVETYDDIQIVGRRA